jgi:hypothetical protein
MLSCCPENNKTNHSNLKLTRKSVRPARDECPLCHISSLEMAQGECIETNIIKIRLPDPSHQHFKSQSTRKSSKLPLKQSQVSHIPFSLFQFKCKSLCIEISSSNLVDPSLVSWAYEPYIMQRFWDSTPNIYSLECLTPDRFNSNFYFRYSKLFDFYFLTSIIILDHQHQPFHPYNENECHANRLKFSRLFSSLVHH